MDEDGNKIGFIKDRAFITEAEAYDKTFTGNELEFKFDDFNNPKKTEKKIRKNDILKLRASM